MDWRMGFYIPSGGVIFQGCGHLPCLCGGSEQKKQGDELRQMEKIIAALNEKPLTKARIHDVEKIQREEIPADSQITEAYRTIRAKTNLGSQHEWLARLGKLRPGLEVGTEAGSPETSHIIHAIEEFGELVLEDGVGYLDPEKSSEEGKLVLGCFRFPIITRTERDMLQLINQWGYEDVMQNIWFCHFPIGGKPCGLCHPCEVKMASEMEFLLPPKAQKRYKAFASGSCHLGTFGQRCLRKLLRCL